PGPWPGERQLVLRPGLWLVRGPLAEQGVGLSCHLVLTCNEGVPDDLEPAFGCEVVVPICHELSKQRTHSVEVVLIGRLEVLARCVSAPGRAGYVPELGSGKLGQLAVSGSDARREMTRSRCLLLRRQRIGEGGGRGHAARLDQLADGGGGGRLEGVALAQALEELSSGM